MDMSLIECLLMTVVSTVVCLCLPRLLTSVGSNLTDRG